MEKNGKKTLLLKNALVLLLLLFVANYTILYHFSLNFTRKQFFSLIIIFYSTEINKSLSYDLCVCVFLTLVQMQSVLLGGVGG